MKQIDISKWMPMWTGDYLRETSHLSTEEHGAYILLLIHYWAKGGPLPDDNKRLANITGLPIKGWTDIRETISEFFQVDNEKWVHVRLDEEMRIAKLNMLNKTKRALKGSDGRWGRNDASRFDDDGPPIASTPNDDGPPAV